MSKDKTFVLDNRTEGSSIGRHLLRHISDSDVLRVVSAYFTIYGYHELRDALASVDKVRFLLGEPSSVESLDPAMAEHPGYHIDNDSVLPKEQLQQKALAKACAAWIRQKVEMRSAHRSNFLHGKMYHWQNGVDGGAVVGSSNFTKRGLGFSKASANIELNLEVDDTDKKDALQTWFDDLWQDESAIKDIKEEVLTYLGRLYQDYDPEFIYYLTLFHLFEKDREKQDRRADVERTNIKDTKIWKALYDFQEHGALGIIDCLLNFNGCILADSVGLGKTYTALAVIKYFELRNENVLVLAPKRLEDNWSLYPLHKQNKFNPFTEDKFRYTLAAHTDLSRESGQVAGTNWDEFNWSNYDLIVIDESHNFRSATPSKKAKDGESEKLSRYDKLLKQAIQEGIRSKVLMLSATPVNTSLLDFRNQIHLITQKNHNFFESTLSIHNYNQIINDAQKTFEKWEKAAKGIKPNKRDLFDKFSGDFMKILGRITIARSRKDIEDVYSDFIKKQGAFPERRKPLNETPLIDLQGKLSYETLHEQINDFTLSIYKPSVYLKEDKRKKYKEQDFERKEKWVAAMMCINLLKRLESSPHAFVLTMKKILGKIDDKIKDIDKFIEDPQKWQAENLVSDDTSPDDEALSDEEGEDEDYEPESEADVRKLGERLNELDVEKWRKALQDDYNLLSGVWEKVSCIDSERDGKLQALKGIVKKKLSDHHNRKLIIFTTFTDTAEYLRKYIAPIAVDLDVKWALVSGKSSPEQFRGTLKRFSPKGQGYELQSDEQSIDLLIATDCISEGQNLQDCDMIVNYDIHWNPVRIVQRFGRIDRLGSKNEKIGMVNFWPTKDLDSYLNLEGRVRARMALVDYMATGSDDPLEDIESRAEYDRSQRNKRLEGIRDGNHDIEGVDDTVSFSDFSLSIFHERLLQYLQTKRKILEKAPKGIYAVADCDLLAKDDHYRDIAEPGVIFCLRKKDKATKDKDAQNKEMEARNLLHPYYMLYVRDNGSVRYRYTDVKGVLELFEKLCLGQSKAHKALCAAFDKETEHGNDMELYDKLLSDVATSIMKTIEQKDQHHVTAQGGLGIMKKSERPQKDLSNFELVTWLILKKS